MGLWQDSVHYNVDRRWKHRRRRRWVISWSVIRYWPHGHRNRPTGLDVILPNFWEDHLSFRIHKVVLPLFDSRTKVIHMKKGLLDEFLDTLCRIISEITTVD